MSVSAVNCSDTPPERPESGTWEWNGNIGYETSITYTCGPYGSFEDVGGNKYRVFSKGRNGVGTSRSLISWTFSDVLDIF